jgi:hypothetical protein
MGPPQGFDDFVVLPPLVSDALFMTEGRFLAFEGNAPPAVVPLNPQQPFGADRTGPATPFFFVAVDRDYLDRIALETFDLDLIRFEPGAFPLRGDLHGDVHRLYEEARIGTVDSRLVMDNLASIITIGLLRSSVRVKGSEVLLRARHPGSNGPNDRQINFLSAVHRQGERASAGARGAPAGLIGGPARRFEPRQAAAATVDGSSSTGSAPLEITFLARRAWSQQ